jgi:murein L,D-transpeptidase YafK
MTVKKTILFILILTFIGLSTYYFFPEQKLPAYASIDSILVFKSKRQLLVYSNGVKLKTYKISLGRNPIGSKQYEGDKRTPEGSYFINDKNPNSGYHKNLGISFPNNKDKQKNKDQKKPLGGNIKIHGLRNGLGFISKFQRWIDWTAGCMALTDEEVDELYNSVKIGTKIEIKP